MKDKKILKEMFNEHYVNIVEKTSGIAPKILGNPLHPKLKELQAKLLKDIEITPALLR